MRTVEVGKPSQDVRDWLEDFMDNLFEVEASTCREAPRSISSGPLDQEPSTKWYSGTKEQFHAVPDRPTVRQYATDKASVEEFFEN